MEVNKNMLFISAFVIIILIGIFVFNIYNDTKLVKINSADIIVTEKLGTMENEKIITVDAGDRVVFYSFDGGNAYQLDNTYVIKDNQSVHIVLQDSDRRVIGEKYYNEAYFVDATDVSLNQTAVKLVVGQTEVVTATISPSDATDKNIIWTSSNTSVAVVENGEITGKKTGTAIITAKTNNGKKAKCKVTVSGGSNNGGNQNGNGNHDVINQGGSENYGGTDNHGGNGNSVSNNGSENSSSSSTETTAIPVTGVSLNKTSSTLAVGETDTLVATIAPSNATNKTITWTSSDTSVATVSNGKITVKKAGTTTITAKSNNGKKATCKVTVTNTAVAVTAVGLNKSNLILTVGGSELLTATINPGNATNKTLTWSSSDSSVATVENGRVTGRNAGTATITVTTNNGKTSTCRVIVLSKQRLINVNNMSFYTYIKKMKLYSGDLASGENFQNFGFKNFNQPGETIYVTNKYKGNGGKEQTKLRIADIDNKVIKYDDKKTNNITKYTTKLLLSNYYSHGQEFDLSLSPNGDQWLMFLTAATEPGGAQYLRVFRDSEQVAFKEYPNLKGQPSIDRENDLIAMVNGTNCKIYKYSDLINNNKETLLYNFNFNRYTTEGGKEYTNGFAIKDGYLYEIRGCYGDNGIEVWNYFGDRVIYRDIPLVSGKTNEPQGIHIYGGTIYIGITEFPGDYNASNWTYTVGYLQ